MTIDDILARVDPKWRVEFGDFLATGRASEDFLEYFDNSPECQQASDDALVLIFSPFEKMLREEDSLAAQRQAPRQGS